MKNRCEAPIGVFDSGVGGLTVVREIMRNLPNEEIVYFGDTARVPYGSKSKETVTRYSRQIVRFLQSKEVKAIVVACNTASAYALETIKKELDIPIIVLSQLSRGPEGRNDKRPMLSDLRESGSIEQDADIVMFLYRDAYYNKDSPTPNISECIVAKNRHGETGTVKLMWDGQFTRFSNAEMRDEG